MPEARTVRWLRYDDGYYVPSSHPHDPELGAGQPIEAFALCASQCERATQTLLSVCADGHGNWTPMPKALSTLQYSARGRGWFGTTTPGAASVRIPWSYVDAYVCARFAGECMACDGEPLECDAGAWRTTQGRGATDDAPSFMEAWIAQWLLAGLAKLPPDARLELPVLLDMVKTRHYPACTMRTLRRVVEDMAQDAQEEEEGREGDGGGVVVVSL